MSAYVLNGTVEVDMSGARFLNIPAMSAFPVADDPVPYSSSVVVSDPADVALFKLLGIGGIQLSNADPELAYLGARSLYLSYQLTGGSPINVDFRLVWDTEAPDLNGHVSTYAGG